MTGLLLGYHLAPSDDLTLSVEVSKVFWLWCQGLGDLEKR